LIIPHVLKDVVNHVRAQFLERLTCACVCEAIRDQLTYNFPTGKQVKLLTAIMGAHKCCRATLGLQIPRPAHTFHSAACSVCRALCLSCCLIINVPLKAKTPALWCSLRFCVLAVTPVCLTDGRPTPN